MRGLLLFVLAFANLHDIWSPDVIPNALLPFTLVREGNANYDEFVFRPSERSSATSAPVAGRLDSEAYFFRACGVSTATAPAGVPRSKGGPPAPGPNDHVCSVFPPGMGLLALPFFLPIVVSGAPALDLATLLRVGHVVAAFYEVLAALLLWALMRRSASERWALALVLVYFLGTSVRTVSSQALWQHAGVHLAIASALWLVLVERPVSLARELLAGLALGLGTVVRQTTAVAAPFLPGSRFGVGALTARYAALVWVAAGFAIGVVPLLVFNALVLGDPLEQGYGAKPFDVAMLGQGLLGLLASPSRGILIYEPFVVFAIAAAAMLRVGRSLVERRLASLAVAWIVALLLYATYAEWWGGRVFGPRFLDDFAPIVFALLAFGIGRGLLGRTWTRVVFWICAAWSLLIFNAAAFVYDQSWDTAPVNVNDDPSRLFAWADPQWLAVLRDVPSGGVRVVAALVLTLLALAFLARVEGLLGRRMLPSAG